MLDIAARPSLTPKQSEILAYIREATEQQGYPPTVRQMAKKFKFASLNSVSGHIRALVKKGYLEKVRRGARALKLTDTPDRGLRIVGRVSAGGLIEAIQSLADIDLSHLFAEADSVAIAGEGLEKFHVTPGDFLIVKRLKISGVVRILTRLAG